MPEPREFKNFACPVCGRVHSTTLWRWPVPLDQPRECCHHDGAFGWGLEDRPGWDLMLPHDEVYIKLDDALLTTQVCAVPEGEFPEGEG